VVGGFMVSQVLTLYITPVIYIYFERLFGPRARRSAPAVVDPPSDGQPNSRTRSARCMMEIAMLSHHRAQGGCNAG
jgi:hypothetical protein